MPQALQGMIIGLLISLLVGVAVGFYLRQGQVQKLTAALQTSQGREQELQQAHEDRLRTATAQLQRDYEAQLADQIERYQQQYEAQRQQLEAEYEARQNLMPAGPGSPDIGSQDPHAPAETWATAPVSEYEARLRQQYEARLKEAAYKIQQAYEQHLRETLTTDREAQQQEYDQRLAEAIARYQDESEARLAEALKAQPLAAQAGMGGTGLIPGMVDETQMQEQLANLEAELRSTYDRRLAERIEQYQDEMSQRITQLEQEFAARLQMAQAAQPADTPPQILAPPSNADIEARLQAQYDQRLAEVVARYQDDLMERTQRLEQEYEARLQVMQGGDPGVVAADTADLEAQLRQDLEANLRAEYDLQLAEKMAQFQATLTQRSQDFEAGLIPTMDPFTDTAISAEALEDDGLSADAWTEAPVADARLGFEEGGNFEHDHRHGGDNVIDADPGDLGLGDLGIDGTDLEESGWEESGPGNSGLDFDFDAPGLDDPGFGASKPEAVEATLQTPDADQDTASDLDAAFNLGDLDLSALSEDDLALDEEDIFNLETLAQRAGVDLGELNTLLNQPDTPPTDGGEVSDFNDEDWDNLG